MRKSLLKTPPSGLSSRLLSPPAALLVGERARRAVAKRNNGAPYTGVPRMRVAVEGAIAEEEDHLAARVRLLEGFVSRTEIADCAHHALQWLDDVLGVSQSICLVRPLGEQSLVVVGAHGLRGSSLGNFSVSVDDWANPLVTALTHRKQTFFPAAHSAADRKRRPSTPFEDGAFHVVPLGSGIAEEGFGLLLIGGAGPLAAEQHWFTTIFSQKLDQILRQQALVEGDRRQGRERSLLYNIINAVTDPILLTDTEGRLLIANSRALTLFTASEEESEGPPRRRAHEQHAAVLGAVEQGDRRDWGHATRAAAREPG